MITISIATIMNSMTNINRKYGMIILVNISLTYAVASDLITASHISFKNLSDIVFGILPSLINVVCPSIWKLTVVIDMIYNNIQEILVQEYYYTM